MEVTKRTLIDRIDIGADGIINPRVKMQVLVDGELVRNSAYRRQVLPGEKVAEVMELIDAELASQGFDALGEGDKEIVSAIATRKHTPEVKAAFPARRGATDAARG